MSDQDKKLMEQHREYIKNCKNDIIKNLFKIYGEYTGQKYIIIECINGDKYTSNNRRTTQEPYLHEYYTNYSTLKQLKSIWQQFNDIKSIEIVATTRRVSKFTKSVEEFVDDLESRWDMKKIVQPYPSIKKVWCDDYVIETNVDYDSIRFRQFVFS
jgi:hypothetical protein